MKPRDPATILVLGFLTALAVNAQTSTPPVSKDEEAVKLATFTVNAEKDSGYLGVETIVGGRLKTNLLQNPTDVSVMTRQMIDDLGLVSFHTASNWLVGSDRNFYNDPAINGTDFGATPSYRGLGSGADTRNGFRTLTSVEPYAVERIEGARGSNAILFGDGPAGGQNNFTTKVARFRNSTEFTVRVDRWGSHIIQMDVDRKVSANLGVRLNVNLQNSHTYIDRSYDIRNGFVLAATYRPWRNAELRFDGSYENGKRSLTERFTDQISKWDGTTTVAGPMTTAPAATTGVLRYSTDKLVWLPSLGHVYNFNSFGTTTGSGLSLVDDVRRPGNFPLLPRRDFYLQPKTGYWGARNASGGLFFEQAFKNGFSLELGTMFASSYRPYRFYGLNAVRVDLNAVLPKLATDPASSPYLPNPNFGKRFTEGTPQLANAMQQNNNFRAALAYEYKRSPALRQMVGVQVADSTQWYNPWAYQWGRTNGTNVDRRSGSNALTTWLYWDTPGREVKYPEVQSDGMNFDGYWVRNQYSYNRLQTFSLATAGYYFHDKLSVIGGWRRDAFGSMSQTIGTFDSTGQLATFNYTKAPVRYAGTKSLGMTFFPIKAVGLYANWGGGIGRGGSSSAFLPGKEVWFTNSTTYSGGVRTVLWGGQVQARVGWYQTSDRDRAVNLTLNNINSIWNAMGHPEKNIISPFTSFADTLDYFGKGWEAEVTVNVVKRFRLTGNVTLPEAKQKNARRAAIEYINTNRKEWENAAKGLDINGNPLTGSNVISPANQTVIANNLPSVYDLITGAAEGRSLDGTYKYRSNVFGVYDLPGEKLQGFSVGGGANFYGKRQIGNQPGQPFAYVYNEASYTVTGLVTYRFKVSGRPTSLQLNVDNLLDWSRPVYSNTSIYQVNTASPQIVYRQTYNYVPPRNFTLTAKHQF